jgi:DNA-binding response OmpR family regulator
MSSGGAISTIAVSPHQPRPLVVVAEDDVAARTMLGFVLELRGFDVVLAVDGRDALDAILVHRPDALVSDMDMPRLDGLGLCRAVRALPAGDCVPVILWSNAEADDSRLLEVLSLGGVEFLSKSLAVTEIDPALRRVLRVAGGTTHPRQASGRRQTDSRGATLRVHPVSSNGTQQTDQAEP